ncbi:hypothetical protein LPJ66_008481 [Kickxella alabastrina]|uniref:Uncharacterized protein n=1 Tax=Kickxella alabastrina TaxID=61397 RepID=A0ACC1IC55_9FUNG|nr:hypothetical protein LPJ66_008481 [Kickxella alabastrina]
MPEMVNSLAHLALHSANFKLQDTASELLLDMAMRREMLQLVVAQAQGSSTAEGGPVEASCVATGAGHDAAAGRQGGSSRRHMRRAAGSRLLEVLSEVLLQSANGSARGSSKQRQRSDAVLVSVCAAMAKQFTLRTEYHRRMIDLAFLPALLGVARQPVSELELLRMLMESLVRLCTFLMAYRLAAAEENATEVLLELGAVDVITACVRQDDQGVSSWGIAFLYEFLSRSFGNDDYF